MDHFKFDPLFKAYCPINNPSQLREKIASTEVQFQDIRDRERLNALRVEWLGLGGESEAALEYSRDFHARWSALKPNSPEVIYGKLFYEKLVYNLDASEKGAVCTVSADMDESYVLPNKTWATRSPFKSTINIEPVFHTLDEIPAALIALAVGLKRAFKATPDAVRRSTSPYEWALLPNGDRRGESLVHMEWRAVSLPGVPYGAVILFDRDHDNGTLFDFGPRGDKPRYGLSVEAPFYALLFSTPGFRSAPSIPILR